MKKIVLLYGSVAGVIMGAMFFITAPLWDNGTITMDNGMWIGYTTMVVALSLVFLGIKTYRDRHQNGTITFGRAFLVGILIATLASIIYALSWETAINTVSKGFATEMQTHYLNDLKAKNASQEEIDRTLAMMENYNNPFYRFLFSLMEVYWVGVVITLISAALLRRREVLPDKTL